MHDLIIRNGIVIDGSGAERQIADVAKLFLLNYLPYLFDKSVIAIIVY